jgi:hypothetical protein
MAVLKGGTSGVSVDSGTSKGLFQEIVGSDGNQIGKTKNIVTLSATNFTAAVAEALVTLTPQQDGVVSATTTSYTVPAGKRFVLTALNVLSKNAGAANQGVICRVRINPSGAVTTASAIVAIGGAGTGSAIANVVGSESQSLSAGWPNLIELPAGWQVGISQIGTATAGNDVILTGYLY